MTQTLPVGNFLGLSLVKRLETELTEGLVKGKELLEKYKDNPQDCPSDYNEVAEAVPMIQKSLDALRKGFENDKNTEEA